LSNFFEKNIQEIEKRSGLRLYGAFLALTHLWTFLFWNRSGAFAKILSADNATDLCFPFFKNCSDFRFFDSTILQSLLYIYLAVAIINISQFLFQPRLKKAYWLFFGLFIFKSFFYIQHYGFMGNYHYMANIVLLLYLY